MYGETIPDNEELLERYEAEQRRSKRLRKKRAAAQNDSIYDDIIKLEEYEKKIFQI